VERRQPRRRKLAGFSFQVFCPIAVIKRNDRIWWRLLFGEGRAPGRKWTMANDQNNQDDRNPGQQDQQKTGQQSGQQQKQGGQQGGQQGSQDDRDQKNNPNNDQNR
jgi:hypothetical protein